MRHLFVSKWRKRAYLTIRRSLALYVSTRSMNVEKHICHAAVRNWQQKKMKNKNLFSVYFFLCDDKKFFFSLFLFFDWKAFQCIEFNKYNKKNMYTYLSEIILMVIFFFHKYKILNYWWEIKKKKWECFFKCGSWKWNEILRRILINIFMKDSAERYWKEQLLVKGKKKSGL